MLLVSQLVIIGLVQSSVVLINHGATAHTLDWYEDDDLDGVGFNYKIQEDLAQDGQPIQYAPFTSSRWHAPSDISSLSSALPPSGTQVGVVLPPAFGGTQVGVAFPPAFAAVHEPIVSRSESVSSSFTVADKNNFNEGLGLTFGEFPSFKRQFNGQNSISKYDSKYDSKEDKNSFHTVHKSVSSSSPTMSYSMVRRVGSYELPPINIFKNFVISKSVSSSNIEGVINVPAPVPSFFSRNLEVQPFNAPAPVPSIFSRNFEVKPVDVEDIYDDNSTENNAFSIQEEPMKSSEENAISTPARSKFVPTLAFLKPVTVAPRPVANLRYQLRQQLSSNEDFTSSVASTTQAPLLATYKPVFKVEQDVEEVKPTNIQVKISDDDIETSKESKESKERISPASTRGKQPIESKFAAITLKRQSKPLSRFRYQHVLALSREDD